MHEPNWSALLDDEATQVAAFLATARRAVADACERLREAFS